MNNDRVVVILGCGPAGLFAAQAAHMCGFGVAIISKKVKSNIYGAQYLHKQIPGLTPPGSSIEIKTIRYGSEQRYAQRVYGDDTTLTSWRKALPASLGWDLRATYDAAWEKFEPQIADQAIDAATVEDLVAMFPLVISTIPAWATCASPKHLFPSRTIMVKPEIDFQVGGKPSYEKNWVLYNGTDEGLWYRCSCIKGSESTEAVAHPFLAAEGGWDVGFKIVDTNCTCHPQVVRAGRMGEWKRGVLTHHAFERTISAITERFNLGVSPVHPES